MASAIEGDVPINMISKKFEGIRREKFLSSPFNLFESQIVDRASNMSRICVKNIGAKTNEAQLKDLFSSKGEVTDVKVMKKTDGSSRKFAFVGFRTELQAQEAQRYFNNSFMGLSRIVVEIAKKLKDEQLQDLKQKHSQKSEEKLKELTEKSKEFEVTKDSKKSSKKVKENVEKDIKSMGKYKAEFIELNKRNKTLAESSLTDDAAIVLQSKTAKRAVDSDNDEEESSDDESVNSNLMHDSDDDKDGDDDDDDNENDPKKFLSDLEYLRSKMKKKKVSEDDENSDNDSDSDSESSDDSSEDNDEDEAAKDDDEVSAEKKEFNDQLQEEGGEIGEGEEGSEEEARLFVKNLPYTCSEEEFQQLFEPYGKVIEVHLPLGQEKKSKGYGFVTFLFPEHAMKAMESLDGSSFQGRVLYITSAMKLKSKEYSAEEIERYMKKHNLSSFQMKKEEERKKQMNKSEGWNAAFVRSDAVIDNIAERYGINQGDLLDTAGMQGGEIAVRMAVAETQVIQENSDYFKEHGVDINALESIHSKQQANKRSTTILLIKNLPPDTNVEELESMFVRYGTMGSFLVPPSKTIALVEYYEPSEARAAFKSLAYRRYHNSPLYLEWAPLGIITTPTDNSNKKKKEISSAASAGAAEGSDVQQDKEQQPANDDNLQEYSTLFVKNLNFITTEETLLHHLQHTLHIEDIRKVIIQKKYKGAAVLSQGYGFIEFKTHTAAMIAMSRINASVLDSHSLEVKPSDKRITVASAGMTKSMLSQQQQSGSSSSSSGAAGATSATAAAAATATDGNKPSNKLIVRNVAFQATSQELRALFAAFGSIKRVRIPKKMGGKHRGFAFIDFSTPQEAANAMASLKNTHFYGRHLVLEWAKADDDDEEMEEDHTNGTNGMIKENSYAAKQILGGDKQLQSLRKRARQDQIAIIQTSKKAKKKVSEDAFDADAGEMEDLI